MKRKKLLFSALLGGFLLLSGPAFGKGIEGIWKMTVGEPPAIVTYTLDFTSHGLLTVTRTVYPEPTDQVSYFAYTCSGDKLTLTDKEGKAGSGEAAVHTGTGRKSCPGNSAAVPESLSISGFDSSFLPNGTYYRQCYKHWKFRNCKALKHSCIVK